MANHPACWSSHSLAPNSFHPTDSGSAPAPRCRDQVAVLARMRRASSRRGAVDHLAVNAHSNAGAVARGRDEALRPVALAVVVSESLVDSSDLAGVDAQLGAETEPARAVAEWRGGRISQLRNPTRLQRPFVRSGTP